MADAAAPPVLVELFTSQSCSSCPPAEALFVDIAARSDVVALEWHVDYWNDISVGANGRWRDPYSDPGNSERQRAYNFQLRNRSSVYTPQIVVNGAAETVGSKRAEIERLIDIAEAGGGAALDIARTDGALAIRAEGPRGAALRLVRFQRSASTRVGGGENAGKHLKEANIVTSTEVLAHVAGGPLLLSATAPASGEGCALLVEPADGGPVLAAQYCP